MTNQPKNAKTAKSKKLTFAIFFVALIIAAMALVYDNRLAAAVARIELTDTSLATLVSPKLHSVLNEEGGYIRILPNGERAELWISSHVYNRFGDRRPLSMRNHNRIISWEVDGLPHARLADGLDEHYYLIRNGIGVFRLVLTENFREIHIRVSSTRNAEIYDTFAIIIDPNMTPPPRN